VDQGTAGRLIPVVVASLLTTIFTVAIGWFCTRAHSTLSRTPAHLTFTFSDVHPPTNNVSTVQ
jgi:hypothetical protein